MRFRNCRTCLRLKCDGTRAETVFRLPAKRTSPFKLAGASVQSTTGSRAVHIIGSNAGYTMFRGSVKGTGYPLYSPFSPSLPLPCVTVCHDVSTGLYESPCFLKHRQLMFVSAELVRKRTLLTRGIPSVFGVCIVVMFSWISLHTRQHCTRWCSWLRRCAISRKVAGSIPDGVIGFFLLT